MSEQKNDNKTQTIRFGIGNKQIIANNTYDNCVVICVEGKDYKTNKLTEKQIDELFDKGLLKRFCEEISDKVVDKLTSDEELACLLKDAVNDAIENKGKSLQDSLDYYAKNINNRLDKIKTTLEGLRGTTEEGFKNTNQKLNDILAKLNKEGNIASTAQSTQTKGESEAAGDNGKQFQRALAKKLTSEYGINISSAEVDENGSCNITICGKVKEIPAHKFNNIKGIAQVIIEDGVTSIGEYAFSGCSDLTSITIPDSVIDIGRRAFYGCSGLTSITIPNSVTSIGSSAFEDCSGLTSITIPDSVTSIGSDVFSGCNSDIVDIEDDILYVDGWVIGCDYSVTKAKLRDATKGIAGSAFSGCSDLTSITIPDSVTSIGNWAFSGCSGLTSVTIPDSVTSIGALAFYGCSGLTSVTIPFVGEKLDGTENTRFNYIFGIVVPYSLKEVVITGGKNIDNDAFWRCRGLKSITIPNSVTSIGSSAFRGCTGLTSVTIPDSVTSIGKYAFSECSGLTSMVVEDGNPVYHSAGNCLIETATKTLIAGCKTSVIPDDGSVTSIGDWAFSDCSGLTSITIPDSVTSIGDRAFFYCSGLTIINFQGTKAQWKAIEKGSYWDYNTGKYTVHCTDGKYKKRKIIM